MRSTDQRLKENMRRTEPVTDKRRLRRRPGADAPAACACAAPLCLHRKRLKRKAWGRK